MAQRHEARKVAKQTKIERETTLDSFDRLSSDESRFSTPIDLPFGGMHREKTVVDVDVSDEQKQAMYSQLMRQQQQAESKRAQQMMRQEEMVGDFGVSLRQSCWLIIAGLECYVSLVW